MRLKLTYNRGGSATDVAVTVDGTTTVGDLAVAFGRRDPAGAGPAGAGPAGGTGAAGVTLRRETPGGPGPGLLPADLPVAESGLRSGDQVSLVRGHVDAGALGEGAAAVLRVLAGPDTGLEVPLRAGVSRVGRAPECEVRLKDPLVSSRHARVVVGDVAEIVDTNSSNGLLVDDVLVPRVVLRPGTVVVLGDTAVTLVRTDPPSASRTAGVLFNRSPFVLERYVGEEREAPEPPERPRRTRLPWLAMLAPMMLGIGLYAVTRQPATLLFVAASPLMLLGSWVDQRNEARRNRREAVAEFREACATLGRVIREGLAAEAVSRVAEHPPVAELCRQAADRGALMWRRRRADDDVLTLSVGHGTVRSRSTISTPRRLPDTEELLEVLREVQQTQAHVANVPVVVDLRSAGSVGFVGPDAARDAARAAVADVVTSHSPADVVVVAVASAQSAGQWRWLRWLPHVSSPHSPLTGDHLAEGAGRVAALVSELERVVAERVTDREPQVWPAVVVVVEDDAPVDRSRLVTLAQDGPACGVHVLWCTRTAEMLPAACRRFVDTERPDGAAVLDADTGSVVSPVAYQRLAVEAAESLGRAMSCLVDAGARVPDDSDLARSVGWLALAGTELADNPEAVVERWTQSESLVDRTGASVSRRTRDRGLRALVGMGAGSPMHLDLRAQGPHALVGGTTGAGKSEFLQSWVLGMASAYGPDRLTFLLVDYKGGAAFADCEHLPHTVGLVTDLSPHLVRRALTSLRAELRHREELFNAHQVKDLVEFERSDAAHLAPPSLVIVVDEFAALVQEVPEFVDGVVNVAQRGRSLGVHLILATQRPAGVIKDNLRANTNLRVALRMADEADSSDVVGTPEAAHFDPAVPGRAAVSSGSGRLVRFQTGYAGGHTSAAPPPPSIDIVAMDFGTGAEWVDPDPPKVERPTGLPDIGRVVQTIRSAADTAEVPEPRRPWLPELETTVDLLRGLPGARRSRGATPILSLSDDRLAVGVADDATNQTQPDVYFEPDVDGGLVVLGAGGAGKSSVLRSLAVAAGITPRGGPCQVYAVDFGASGLAMLDPLPHVGAVISGDDDERLTRLLRRLRAMVDERADRYAQLNAGSIGQYRTLADAPDESRVLLLVDGLGTFREQYEHSVHSPVWRLFSQVALDGRAVGIHVVASADRPGSVPPALGSALQRRLVLRLGDEADYGLLGIPMDVLSPTSPPGRGVMDGLEVQAAVVHGTGDVARQAAAIRALATSLAGQGGTHAEPVGKLPELVPLAELPVSADSGAVIGLADDTLGPVGITARGTFVVCGPPGSGRTSALATLSLAIRRVEAPGRLVYIGQERSMVAALDVWDERAVTPDEIRALCLKLTAAADPVRLLVVESVTDFLGSGLDGDLAEAVTACGATGLVVAEGETSALSSSWPLLSAVKAGRRGFALQPDSHDGDAIFRTPFPRVARKEFPVGRGLLVERGSSRRVQLALPELR